MPRQKGVPPKRDTRTKINSTPDRTPRGMITWDPKYCAMLLEHMKKGGSFPSFAGVIGCCFETLYDWIDEKSPRFHPDFSEARARGEACLFLTDEQIGTAGITGQLKRVSSAKILTDQNGNKIGTQEKYAPAYFSATAYNFRMKNRYPQFYKDRSETAITDPDGNRVEPVQIVISIPRNGKEKKD